MLNLLTIDLEDYFQVHAFSRVIRYEDWNKFECRIQHNTNRLLEILSSVPSPQYPPKATFFVLGWIAERYPGLIQRIQKEGHEIACHGYAHRLVYTESKDEFRQDIKKAKAILEAITGSEVIGYRAPSYSITIKSQWAFETLVEEGFKYDSSIFPICHDFYGMPNAPRFPFVVSLNGNNNFEFSMLNFESNAFPNSELNTQNSELKAQPPVLKVLSLTRSLINPSFEVSSPRHSATAASFQGVTSNSALRTPNCLLEFPLSTVKLFGQNAPISGGGYFRLFPYSLIRKGLRTINEKEKKPFIFYIHPWELDFEQPRIREVSLRSKFRHYVNLNKTESKFKRLLRDFQFSPIRQLLVQNS